jgi:hypothetical protein
MNFDFMEPTAFYAVETQRNHSETGLIIDNQEKGTLGTRNSSRFETAWSDCYCFCFNLCARSLPNGGGMLAPPPSGGEGYQRDDDYHKKRYNEFRRTAARKG